MPTLGERIAELRKTKGVTQQELANFLGVTLRTVQNYEYMKREPSIEQLKQLANFFDVSIDYLVGNSDDPTPPKKSVSNKEENANISSNEKDDDIPFERVAAHMEDRYGTNDPEFVEFVNRILKEVREEYLQFKREQEKKRNRG